MSHTILKPQLRRANYGNTLLHELSGTFEVYWEQLRNLTRGHRRRELDSDIEQDIGIKDTRIDTKYTQINTNHASRLNTNAKFIEANVVFG
jgi:hypothetical protein